jgi:RNA polymerase sigma-70 factor (ECF subfamily)
VADDLTEPALAALAQAGDTRELATRILRAYGPEILSYLFASLRGDGEAGDAFSQFTLNLWQAIGTFRGESSFRTWAYALARHAVGRIVRERGKHRRQVPLSGAPELDALAARMRTETLSYLHTERREQVAALRAELDPDDQTLLILRVDRGFSWPEIAKIMEESNAAALRKRFERIKDRIRRATR